MHYIFIISSSLKILSIVLPLTLISSTSRTINFQATPPMFVSFLFLLIVPIFSSILLNYLAFKIQNQYMQKRIKRVI